LRPPPSPGAFIWRYLAAPPPNATAAAPESPKVDVIHARRAKLAQRLVSNATLEAFEEAELFAKVSGYLSDVRVDIGDHVKSGQLLAIVDVPEMDQELAEAIAQLESQRRSLEAAQRQVEHNKADLALQEVTFKRQNILNKDRWVSDQALDEIRAKADVAKADVQLAEANLSPPRRSILWRRRLKRTRRCSLTRGSSLPSTV
jgi:multidrug efflux pump subunit AcrA (membrane-fusion protein)